MAAIIADRPRSLFALASEGFAPRSSFNLFSSPDWIDANNAAVSLMENLRDRFHDLYKTAQHDRESVWVKFTRTKDGPFCSKSQRGSHLSAGCGPCARLHQLG